MEKKLRRRFISVSAFCIFAVLLIFILFINLWNLGNVIQNANKTLTIIQENGGYFPKPPKDKDKEFNNEFKHNGPLDQSPEAPFSTRYFSVTLDESGSELSVNTGSIAAISTNQAAKMAGIVSKKGKASGFYGVYRYSILNKDSDTFVVFLDCTRDLYNLKTFALNSGFICISGFLAVCILIIIFSKAAVRPIVQSYENQKSFITNAGHELKTPLSVISANTEVIELETGENQWTKSIRNQISRMANLTSELTALAKLEESALAPAMEEFNLSDLIKSVCDDMEAAVLSRNRQINYPYPPAEPILCRANEEQIRQLLFILLDNAVKYSIEHSSIYISLVLNGRGAKLIVKNNACLEQDGNLNILMERFYRTDSSRTRTTGGYGLGLSIAKAIVDAHKGKITIFAPNQETLEVTVKL